MKTCTKCGVEKDLEAYSPDKRRVDGRQARCKNCCRVRAVEKYHEDPQKHRDRKKQEYARDPEKQRRRDKDRRAANLDKYRERARQRYARDPDAKTSRDMKSKYGIDLETYNQILDAQGGVCDICGLPETAKLKGKVKRLAIDHCHETGEIRALLCQSCNTMLGRAKDSPDLLRKAADYLESHHARLGRDQT